MSQASHSRIVSFIWGVADDVLRDLFVRGRYGDVILPMCVLCRLDAVLEPTREKVRETQAMLDREGITEQHAALTAASGQAFYNTSRFCLRDMQTLGSQRLRPDFDAYLDGFSQNVQEILANLEFRHVLLRLLKFDAFGLLIQRFLDPEINWSPHPVLNDDESVRLAGMDNHSMGVVFEELVRKFNEELNEVAGEHSTPRDAARLMTTLMFQPIADRMKSGSYTLYDGACGTGGMLTLAEEAVERIAGERRQRAVTHLYGQEVNPETFAICKAEMLMKGREADTDHIVGGPEWSTLSHDAFPGLEFDFMLAHPPYGKSWKNDLEAMGGKDGMRDPRFRVMHQGGELSLVTRSSDGQLLFLANMASKMNHESALGSRIAEIHNGSSLFTGDAGQGESNIRRWLFENDWVEAIVALPLNMFHNTGIATYVWVLSNRKAEHRKGKVQLIDASGWFKPLRKSVGKKNCEVSEEDISRLMATYDAFADSEHSKVLANEAFGYWKVTVERPLRVRGIDPERAYSRKELKALRETGQRDKKAPPVIAKIHELGKVADPLRGLFEATIDGKIRVVEYEPDSDLRHTKQVPMLEKGGVEAFVRREVLPYAPDGWMDERKVQIGYAVRFARHLNTLPVDVQGVASRPSRLALEAFGVKNVRCLRETGLVPIRPITVLVGHNSSGKSTFLRTFPLLRQSVEKARNSPILWDDEKYVDFGSIRDAATRLPGKPEVTFQFRVRLPTEAGIAIKDPTYDIAMTLTGEEVPYVSAYEIRTEGHVVRWALDATGNLRNLTVNDHQIPIEGPLSLGGKAYLLPTLQSGQGPGPIYREATGASEMGDIKGRTNAHDVLIKPLAALLSPLFHDRASADAVMSTAQGMRVGERRAMRSHWTTLSDQKYYQQRLEELDVDDDDFEAIVSHAVAQLSPRIIEVADMVLAQVVSNVAYLKPLRLNPQRTYRIKNFAVNEVDPDGENLAMFLHSLSADEAGSFARFTSTALDIETKVHMTGIHAEILVKEGAAREFFNLVDVGFGYSEVLPLAAVLWATCIRPSRSPQRQAPLVVIEQPELHLHPAAQARLAGMFREAVAGTGARVIVETHSETLINGVGNLIYDGQLRADDVQIVLFDKDEKTGEGRVRLAGYRDNGALHHWPYGFLSPVSESRDAPVVE